MQTIDTATCVPLISHDYLQCHPVLRTRKIHEVLYDALQLRSANGSRMHILGFISSDLTLGSETPRAECFVTPSLGPDFVLLNNEILVRFDVMLDWSSQTLHLKIMLKPSRLFIATICCPHQPVLVLP